MKLLIISDQGRHHDLEALYPLARGLASDKKFDAVHFLNTNLLHQTEENWIKKVIPVDDRFSYRNSSEGSIEEPEAQFLSYDAILHWFEPGSSPGSISMIDSLFPGAIRIGREQRIPNYNPAKSLRESHRFYIVNGEIAGTNPFPVRDRFIQFHLDFSTAWFPPEWTLSRRARQFVKRNSSNLPDFFTLEVGMDAEGKPAIGNLHSNTLGGIYMADILSGQPMIQKASASLAELIKARNSSFSQLNAQSGYQGIQGRQYRQTG